MRLFVGCDRIKSKTRRYVFGRNDPKAYAQCTKKYCYRGLTPIGKAVEAIGEELAVDNQVYLGRVTATATYSIEK